MTAVDAGKRQICKLCPSYGPNFRPPLSTGVRTSFLPASGRTCSILSCSKTLAGLRSGMPLSGTPVMCNFANDDFPRRQGTTMRTGLLTAALTLIPAAAFAHTGVGDVHGFATGFAHPLGGLDHILAMMTVGIFAWQLGGRALWLVPAAFVLAMAIGAALGVGGVPLPFVEFAVAASVVVLGGIVAFACRAPIAIAMAVVAL